MCMLKSMSLLLLTFSTLAADFQTGFRENVDRYFVGPEIWTNPMEAWKVRNGRLEVDLAHPNLNAQVLTHQIKSGDGSFEIKVDLGNLKDTPLKSLGFSVGIKSELGDYRSALLFGRGLNAGVNKGGKLFLGKAIGPKISAKSITLLLTGTESSGSVKLTLKALEKDQ